MRHSTYIVTITTTNYRIMGFPVSIQNTVYERNGKNGSILITFGTLELTLD